MAVNSSSYMITNVIKLDGGTNNLAFSTSTLQTFNGGLYFHLHKDNKTGILTSLNGLSSSNWITLTTYTNTKSEN